MALYYVTAIEKDTIGNHTYITRLLVHLVENNLVYTGTVYTKDQLVTLVDGINVVRAAIWNYTDSHWIGKGLIDYEVRNNIKYLRSNPNNTVRDNLLHLLPLANLGK